MIKKRLILPLIVIMLLFSSSLCYAEYVKYADTFFGTFDTVVTVMGYAEDQAVFTRAVAYAQEKFTYLHQQFDNYHEYEGINNLCTLNKTAGISPVTVSKELFDLLVYCKETQPKLQNTVNIAMGAVLSIWHTYREAGLLDPENAQLPPMEELLAARAHTNMDDLILDPENLTVFYADPEMKLDLGAVAKGYSAGLVAQSMLSSDMPSFIIDAGGNICTGNPPMDGRLRWGISIQDPDGTVFSDANTDIMDVLFLTNTAVVTSGDYQRYYTVNNRRYHHIISPETLMPANYMRSVTIVTRDSAYADILSTAVFLMPYEEGRAFVDSLDGVEAFWVLNDRTVMMTDGMAAMAKSIGATSK
jgi:FAD:protein FMN transferase